MNETTEGGFNSWVSYDFSEKAITLDPEVRTRVDRHSGTRGARRLFAHVLMVVSFATLLHDIAWVAVLVAGVGLLNELRVHRSTARLINLKLTICALTDDDVEGLELVQRVERRASRLRLAGHLGLTSTAVIFMIPQISWWSLISLGSLYIVGGCVNSLHSVRFYHTSSRLTRG